MAAARAAQRAATFSEQPSASATANAPLNASPAAVASTARTETGSTQATGSPVSKAGTSNAPRSPSVASTVRAPRSCNRRAARSTDSIPSTAIPLRIASSVSFGVSTSTISSQSRRAISSEAGAGFKIVATPCSRAFRRAASCVSSGVSRLASSTRADRHAAVSSRSRAAGPSAAFAPDATAIAFWPEPSTTIRATPVAWPAIVRTWEMSKFASAPRAAFNSRPKASSPTAPRNRTGDRESRAAATA